MAKKQIIKEYVDRGVKPHDPTKKNCIVTDLDGTLALINGRGYFDSYKFGTDIINIPDWEVIQEIMAGDTEYLCDLIIITGRSSAGVGRRETEDWLRKEGVDYTRL